MNYPANITEESMDQWNKEFLEVTEMKCGADWRQVVTLLGCDIEDNEESEPICAEAVREVLKDILNICADPGYHEDDLEPEQQRAIDILRHHVWGMVEYDLLAATPLYEGLSRVEDDFAFVNYCCRHLEELWT